MIQPYHKQPGLALYCGDARAVLAQLPSESVHCCVTSPPYFGLRDYGVESAVWGGSASCEHEWQDEIICHRRGKVGECSTLAGRKPSVGRIQKVREGTFCARCGAWRGALGLEPALDLYVEHLVAVFREVKRVLRGDGTLWLNLGDSYASGMRSAYDDDRHYGGARAHDQRPPTPAGAKPKDLLGIPWLVAFALRADGWYLRSDIIWHKPNCMPESVQDRPTTAHEHVFLLAKSEHYYYDAEAIKEPVTGGAHPRGNGVNPKALLARETPGQQEANETRLHRAMKTPGANSRIYQDRDPQHPVGRKVRQNESFSAAVAGLVANRNRRSVWTIATVPFAGAHFATFPPALVEPMIQAGTSERGCCPVCGAPWVRVNEKQPAEGRGSGNKERKIASNGERSRLNTHMGSSVPWSPAATTTTGWEPSCGCGGEPVPCIVLDPFAGAGTTAVVANRLGRRAILCDLNRGYCDMIVERCAQAPLMAAMP